MSYAKHQQVQAVRIAAIPEPDFEAQVEALKLGSNYAEPGLQALTFANILS